MRLCVYSLDRWKRVDVCVRSRPMDSDIYVPVLQHMTLHGSQHVIVVLPGLQHCVGRR